MRFIGIIRGVLTTAAAVLTLSACGGNTDCTTDTEATPVVRATDYGYGDDQLECTEAYTPIEIGVGTHTEKDASYTLTEMRGEEGPYPDVQQGVKLHAKPPAGITIPSAIVHTVDSDDKELQVSIGKNGVVDTELKTVQYARRSEYYNSYPISSITFCTK